MNDQSRVSPVVRSDANHLAMKVARSVLDAAHDFEFTFDDAKFVVAVERLPASPWPTSGVEGLSTDADGPWPAAVRLRCSWPNGSAVLLMEASYWRGTGQYRHLVGVRVTAASARREVLWITLALPLRSAKDGAEAVVEASFTPFRKRNEPEAPSFSLAQAAREIVARAQLPFTSDFRVGRVASRFPQRTCFRRQPRRSSGSHVSRSSLKPSLKKGGKAGQKDPS